MVPKKSPMKVRQKILEDLTRCVLKGKGKGKNMGKVNNYVFVGGSWARVKSRFSTPFIDLFGLEVLA